MRPYPILCLALTLSCVYAADKPGTPPDDDVDVNGAKAPLDQATAETRKEPDRNPAVADGKGSTSAAGTNGSAPTAPGSEKKPLTANNAGGSSSSGSELGQAVENAPSLPEMPASAQSNVTQIGGLTLTFIDTSLDDVCRVISRSLDRPLHVALVRRYQVFGSWHNARAQDIIKDIAAKYGLTYRETPRAYIIEDNGRTLSVAQAQVQVPPEPVTGSSIVGLLTADSVVKPVAPLTGKAAVREMKRISTAEDAAAAERERLQHELNP